MLTSLVSAQPLLANLSRDSTQKLRFVLLNSMSRNQALSPCFRHKNYLTAKYTSSSNIDDPKKLACACSSTIFLQDGLSIRELPILVQTADLSADDDVSSRPDGQKTDVNSKTSSTYNSVVEVAAVQDGLKNCSALSEIFELLEVIPVEEVTPQVATFALHRIATLQSGVNSGMMRRSTSREGHHDSINGLMDMSFAWRAIVDRLVNTILLGGSPRVLLEGLKAAILVRKFVHVAYVEEKTGADLAAVDRFVRECMAIVAKGQMPIEDTCELASTLNSISKSSEVDKLWPSFVYKSNSIDESNVADVYKTLPLLRKSRKVVLGVLQKRMHAFWWKLRSSDVLVILDVLHMIHFAPSSFLTAFTKWFSLSVHTLSESNVSNVVALLQRLDHFDANIGRSLERYVKARSKNNNESTLIDDQEVMATICDFCVHFRYSSVVILDALAARFQSMGRSMSTNQIFRVARTLGILNHVPVSATARQFFAALEESIDARFIMFKPEDLVELLLSCTHIQRYPINFARRVFSPFFLGRIGSIQDEVTRCRATVCLRLLDIAMALECPHYEGPMLHRDMSAKSLRIDGRLLRFHSWLDNDFADVLGGRDKFATMECLPNVPLADMYICDFLYNLDENDSPLPFYKKSGFRTRKAVIVHLPENYVVDRRCLIGQQAARVRHLQVLGYSVLQFDYHELDNLRTRQSTERLDYLRKKLLL